MRYYYTVLAVLFFNFTYAQKQFDSSKVESILLSLPNETTLTNPDTNIIRAIEAVDKNFRTIVDTLYSKPLKYTIFQTPFIETNDSVFINPLDFGDRIKTGSIIFNNKYLNTKVDSIRKSLTKNERAKFYLYLTNNFDHFSKKKNKLNSKAVRLKYIKFPDSRMVNVGIDIYGQHFLWTIDRQKNWDVIKVEDLWVY